jgi:hypothetical protein
LRQGVCHRSGQVTDGPDLSLPHIQERSAVAQSGLIDLTSAGLITLILEGSHRSAGLHALQPCGGQPVQRDSVGVL